MLMNIPLLIDSSLLIALYDQSIRYHAEALAFSQQFSGSALVPVVALTEVVYLMRRQGGVLRATRFLHAFRLGEFQLLMTTIEDLERVEAIMIDYADASFDFVDCCVMALAERLNITQIATFDRRDFLVYRPLHCDYLTLYP